MIVLILNNEILIYKLHLVRSFVISHGQLGKVWMVCNCNDLVSRGIGWGPWTDNDNDQHYKILKDHWLFFLACAHCYQVKVC